MKERIIRPETVKAIEILLSLFSDKQKRLLDISVNGKTIPLVQQFVSRGGNYVPVHSQPIVFEAEAAKVLATHKYGIDLIEKLENDDLFSKLLDPANGKDVSTKKTIFKGTDKRQIDAETDHANMVRSIGRAMSGDSGTNASYDYGADGDMEERLKLDSMKLEKPETPLLSTETGQEDHTVGTDEAKEEEDGIKKLERLDHVQSGRRNTVRPKALFAPANGSNLPEGSRIDIFDANVSQSSNVTLGDNLTNTNTFIEGLRRQNYDTTRENIILAEAINKITKIDFMDVRERLFKPFDSLFRYQKVTCP